jgi:putative membrane protein
VNAHLALANAVLVSISAVCMVLGYLAVRRKQITRHRNFMLAAFVSSAAFMVVFVLRFVKFGRQSYHGSATVLYNVLFFSHEPLAVVSLPLVLSALVLGLRRLDHNHRDVGRFALPIWLFAAISGIALYALLYR